MERKLLVTHSMHRQKFKFPFPDGTILISWDGIPQALSNHYEVDYIPISWIKTIKDIESYEIILFWYDDIYNPNLPIWDFVDDKINILQWQEQHGKRPEMDCVERNLIHKRLQMIDIIIGVTESLHHAHYFAREDTFISNIINSIDFNTLYTKYKDLEAKSYNTDIAVLEHVIEPMENVNWSMFLLSMKVMNKLGYKVGYQSRVYRLEENIEFTDHIKSFGINCRYFPFMDIHDYIIHLSKCKLMFELHKYNACSTAVIASLFGKVPSIGSPSWYQNALFPDLVIREFDYNWIKETCERLQGSFRTKIINKGYELARQLDHEIVGRKLHSLIEEKAS